MNDRSTIRWEQDADGVVNLILDDPNQSANTMNAAYAASMKATVDRLEAERDSITGVVITSAKKTFFAGGDLNDLKQATKENAAEVAEHVRAIKADLRRLETLGTPVVSAINGAALGGGLELALATHHRIAVDDPKIQLGLPEVTLGLLPGGGGVVRTVRLLGIERALTSLLLQGQRMTPREAHDLGLVGEIVDRPEQLMTAAKAWIAAHAGAVQPWDVAGYAIPGGVPQDRATAGRITLLPAALRRRLKGAEYPAPKAILAAAVEGARVDLDRALEIEGRYFVELVTGQVAKNMIQAFFFDLQAVSGARGRATDRERWTSEKVVVLGAGMMGAAIAYVCAKAGIEVVLKDVSLEAAERGKGYSKAIVDKQVAKGRSSQEKADALLGRILPTADAKDAQDADLVIEAVFEDPAVKAQVFAEIEPFLKPDALLGSNTSTLPITGLAEGVSRPDDFIGLHFFSPVDKMPLLEIINGTATSAATTSRALDLAQQIGKTPIVVNDSRGFFTSRVIITFINEALAMLAEGVPAPSIEQASSQAGYPAPVLQLADELNLRLIRSVRDEARKATEQQGGTWTPHPAEAVVDRMIDAFDRPGRLAGSGFYDYDERGRRTTLWPGLVDAFGGGNREIPFEDLVERMLFVEAIESVRVLDEGVLTNVSDANVGSILGIGYPGWTGGVLQYIDGYAGGVAGFVARATELAARYGDRFTPPASLERLAEAGVTLAASTPEQRAG